MQVHLCAAGGREAPAFGKRSMRILRIIWSVASVLLHLPHVPRGFRIPKYIHAIALVSFLVGAFLVWYILRGVTPTEDRPPIILILLPFLLPGIAYWFGLMFLTPLHGVRRSKPNKIPGALDGQR